LVAAVAWLTATAVYPSAEPPIVRVVAAPVQSPLSTHDLPENEPPTPHRISNLSAPITGTSGIDGPTLTPYRWWPPNGST